MSRSASRRRRPAARFGIRAVAAAVVIVIAAVPFGLLLFLVQGEWRPLLRIDREASEELHGIATGHEGFVAAMEAVSDSVETPVQVVMLALLVGYLLWRRRPRLAVFAGVTVAVGPLLSEGVKAIVGRARPELLNPVSHETGLSFPSGHAQAALVACAVLLLVFLPSVRGAGRRLAVAGAVTLVIGVGFSRVALGVHYVSDVLGGYALGAAWVAAMAAAFNAWQSERGRPEARLETRPSRAT